MRVLPERQALALASDERTALNIGLSIVVNHPELSPADIYQEEISALAHWWPKRWRTARWA